MLAPLGLFNLHELLGRHYCKKVLMCNGTSIGHHRKRCYFSSFMGKDAPGCMFPPFMGPLASSSSHVSYLLRIFLTCLWVSYLCKSRVCLCGFLVFGAFFSTFVFCRSFLLKCLAQNLAYLHHLFWILNS